MNQQSPQATDLLSAIEDKRAMIGVIGLGYVGLPLAMTVARAGFKVTGFDIDPSKMTAIEAGKSYIEAVPDDVLSAERDAGRFAATTDFARLAECDVIALALGVRQAIAVVGTAKKLGWNDVKFLNTSAGFLAVVAAVPGGVTEGLYASAGWVDLQSRAADPAVAKFMADYKAKFDQDAGGFAMLGYSAADTVIRALEAAGPDLTQDSFIAGMESLSFYDELADAKITYGPEDHQGADEVVISIVENGQWKVLSRQ